MLKKITTSDALRAHVGQALGRGSDLVVTGVPGDGKYAITRAVADELNFPVVTFDMAIDHTSDPRDLPDRPFLLVVFLRAQVSERELWFLLDIVANRSFNGRPIASCVLLANETT